MSVDYFDKSLDEYVAIHDFSKLKKRLDQGTCLICGARHDTVACSDYQRFANNQTEWGDCGPTDESQEIPDIMKAFQAQVRVRPGDRNSASDVFFCWFAAGVLSALGLMPGSPCPKCETRPTLPNDYLCEGCRYGC